MMTEMPGLIRPCFSASFIMLRHMRSLMLPPGFRDSSFAAIVAFEFAAKRFRRISGVSPTVSRTLLYILFMWKDEQSLQKSVAAQVSLFARRLAVSLAIAVILGSMFSNCSVLLKALLELMYWLIAACVVPSFCAAST
jgi:hypothetical protein